MPETGRREGRMKPAPFAYECPETLDAALALMADEEREPMALAGGQSLIPMMNFRVARPGVLVDLNRIAALAGIEVGADSVRVGAMTRYAAIERSGELAAAVPILARVLPSIAHPAIRNRATLGGSLTLADPAAEMPAVALALGAMLHVAGAEGEREIAADDFFLGAYSTALPQGALLVAASFPAASEGDRFGFHEVTRRHGDYAIAGAVVARTGRGFRAVLFGVGDGPLRVRAAETVLEADASNHAGAAEALDEIEITSDAHSDAATKRHLARVAMVRALEELET